MNFHQIKFLVFKVFFLFVVFASYTAETKAQNYFPLQIDSLQFFVGSNYTTSTSYSLNGSDYKALYIDSVELLGNYEVFHNFTTTRDTSSLNFECIDLYGGSWLGNKIIKNVNQTLIFLNYLNDSIYLKWNASVGDSWMLYQFDDSSRIVATVNSVQTANIYSINDSTKKIILQYYDQNNQIAPHSLNGKEIILSKNYGAISLPDFYYFPNDDIMFSRRYNMKDMSYNDIYNFNIGDVFCYKLQITDAMSGFSFPPDNYVYHIESKFYTQNNTFVNYGRWIEYYDIYVIPGIGLDTNYSSYFDTISINISEKYPLPESSVVQTTGFDYVNLDTISSSLYNGLAVYTHAGLIFNNSTCMVINSFEPSPYEDYYGIGIGLLSSKHLVFGGGNPTIYYEYLVGYIKNGIQTGMITSIKNEISKNNNLIQVISTQANQLIIKYFGELACNIVLFNSQGQQVLASQKIQPGYNNIEIPTLSNGIYYIELLNKEGAFTTKVSIVH